MVMARKPPSDFLDWLGMTDAPNWPRAPALGNFFGVVLMSLFFGALIAAGTLLARTIMGGIDTAAGSLGAGTLIVALLGAPFLIWNTMIKQKALEFQKEGHITDRIAKALEQLGVEKTTIVKGKETTVRNIEVRIGGLLSLERISQDSVRYDNGRDHVRVMEILCAYVRENAPASGARDFPLPEWEGLADDASDAEKAAQKKSREARFANRHESNARQWADSLPKPREDIALALQIIGRRDADQRLAEARWGPEATPDATWVFDTPCPVLRPILPEPPEGAPHGKDALDSYLAELEKWLSGIRAYTGYRPDLRETNLQGADLSNLILSGSLLREARMEGADLSAARMEGADLRFARMEGANLIAARMEGANLIEARMEGAVLFKARMQGAVLSAARMQGAVLRAARMEGAVLSFARMEGADLSRARMEGANLWQARMDNSTSLSAAVFQAAALREVDWTNTQLKQDQVNSMFGDFSAEIPDTLTRPAHWPDWALPYGGRHDFDDEYQRWRADPDTYTPPRRPETTSDP